MAIEIVNSIYCFLQDMWESGAIVKTLAYIGGLVLFDAVASYLTGGFAQISKVPELLSVIKNNKLGGWLVNLINNNPAKRFACRLGIKGGCFVKDTPVLIASTSNQFFLKNALPAMGIATMTIVTPLPIQDVQLFDYAVAHKMVNSSYGLTANANETYAINKDPYTSVHQKLRDLYEINNTDWNEVTFEQLEGTSQCKLALHGDWIVQNSYAVGELVNMNLPEQGISGPFRITSIKHISPQKKPVDDDETDNYEYRLVTGLFTHQSNDVWKLTFDDGTVLGVTNNHPIFSITKGDWQLAGYLEIGEEILAMSGNVKVESKVRDLTLQFVYNLEVIDLHNFLVGAMGVVVHNSYLDEILEAYKDIIGSTGVKHIFHGEIKNGKAYGCHHIRAVKDGKAKLLSNKIEISSPGLGIYKAKVEVDGIPKIDNDGYSTFFPDNWNEMKTMDKIKEAQNNVLKL
ncbi:MAG: EndoU domain-containing protein [Saprospiraceae bacterium]